LTFADKLAVALAHGFLNSSLVTGDFASPFYFSRFPSDFFRGFAPRAPDAAGNIAAGANVGHCEDAGFGL
jgi:hypothetical protein